MIFVSKDYSNKIFTIPNILTLLRIILIPIIAWLYAVKNMPYHSAAVLILSGVTDVVDGFIARHFNMISNFGKALDPVADKLTQFVLLICLVFKYTQMIVPCLLLMIKEIVSGITALCAIKRTGKVDGANWHGKLCTVILYTMLFVHILWNDIPKTVSMVFVCLSVLMMLVSSVMYNVRNIRAYKDIKVNDAI